MTGAGPEILAPAGSLSKMRTAFAYGADAVYLAGPRFGLRQAADNFLPEEFRVGCAEAKRLKRRVYVTLNAFLFDHELEDLPEYLNFLEEMEVDAVIVSDLGVLQKVRRHSKLPIHISTQASCLNAYSARFWRDQGAKRVVLGREVSIEEAQRIRERAEMEVEVFVHGAMCMAFSGNCTISNYTAGRDSNRGGCVQSCRFSYQMRNEDSIQESAELASTFLSSKDLRTIDLMPQILNTSIDSLKIEGRNKGPLYLATAVRNYARARDQALIQNQPVLMPFIEDLEKLSYRGYTRGNLAEKAKIDSVYHQKEAMPSTYQMLGHVVDRKVGTYFAVHLRHNLKETDHVDILGYQHADLQLDTTQMRDGSARQIGEAKPNAVVYFPDRETVEIGMVLRKQVKY